jgi:hypothetical protein
MMANSRMIFIAGAETMKEIRNYFLKTAKRNTT